MNASLLLVLLFSTVAGGSFLDAAKGFIGGVKEKFHSALETVENFVTGKSKDVTQIAAAQATLEIAHQNLSVNVPVDDDGPDDDAKDEAIDLDARVSAAKDALENLQNGIPLPTGNGPAGPAVVPPQFNGDKFEQNGTIVIQQHYTNGSLEWEDPINSNTTTTTTTTTTTNTTSSAPAATAAAGTAAAANQTADDETEYPILLKYEFITLPGGGIDIREVYLEKNGTITYKDSQPPAGQKEDHASKLGRLEKPSKHHGKKIHQNKKKRKHRKRKPQHHGNKGKNQHGNKGRGHH